MGKPFDYAAERYENWRDSGGGPKQGVSPLIFVGLLLAAVLGAFLLWRTPDRVSDGFDRVLGLENKQPLPAPAAKEKEEDADDKKAEKAPRAKNGHARKTVAAIEQAPPLQPLQHAIEPPLPLPAAPGVKRPEPVLPPPFPTANDIQVGLDRTTLLTTFGPPTLKTTTMDRQRLSEAFVYLSRNRNTATFVLLREGRVVSINTSTY